LKQTSFETFLFTTDINIATKATDAGVNGIIIDWENKNKGRRQAGSDTQINYDTAEDLASVSAAVENNIICRINNTEEDLSKEIEIAILNGANEILIPMVRAPKVVEKALKIIDGRVGLGILIETTEGIENAAILGEMPLTRIYIGLNDLNIDRGGNNIFGPLIDGTIDNIRHHIKVPFGFGGLTLEKLGHPVPCGLFMNEMARLAADFSFLRRSFLADIKTENYMRDIASIYKSMNKYFKLSESEINSNRKELCRIIKSL